MKKIELSESGMRKLKEALRRFYEREARVEDSLKEYAKRGRYNILRGYQPVYPENPQDCIIYEEGVFGELIYQRNTRVNRATGKISQEIFIDITNLVEDLENEEKGL